MIAHHVISGLWWSVSFYARDSIAFLYGLLLQATSIMVKIYGWFEKVMQRKIQK